MIVRSLRTKGGRENFCIVLTVLLLKRGHRLATSRADFVIWLIWMGGKKQKPLQVRVSLRNKTSPGLFSGLSSALLPRHMGLKSCTKKRRRKKTFPFCPLCEFNGVIYDDEGGNVWRGTWRKPAEDKIIKQDVGNTHTDVNEARSRSIIKRLFLVLVKADGRPPISRGLLRLLMKECWVSVN